MSKTIHVFDFLDAAERKAFPPVIVLFGDDSFFKRLALTEIRAALLGDGDDAPYAVFEGKASEWRDVHDELSTVALFGGGGPRLAVVQEADDFVSKNRAKLEDYVEKPKASGVLVLVVESWASNTRLYKALDKSGLQVECSAPYAVRGKRRDFDAKRAAKWLGDRARREHDAQLAPMAAELLLDLVGSEFGLLDQGLAKLALFAGPKGKISPEMVQEIVGGWRSKTTWDLLDAAADGNAAEALQMLDRLLLSGENPLALFGQISWSLRRYAAATRIYEHGERTKQRIRLRDALQQAGFRTWQGELEAAEKRLVQLGRERAGQFYRWLLEADLALKGTHSNDHRARFVLELLIVRMAKEALPRKKAAG